MNNTQNITAVKEQITKQPRRRYAFERNELTEQLFRQAGATELLVTIAGFKLRVCHLGETLVSIHPNSQSAGYGSITLYPYQDGERWVNEQGYYVDRAGRVKLMHAIDIAYTAWLAARGNRDNFYKAIGKRGYCALCGRGLTDELSMSRGIGPECYGSIYGGLATQYLVQKDKIATAQ
jgi:hypothetical protein